MNNVTNRKIRKPLMERKRRARINQSLDELHQLLTEVQIMPKGTKLEKADILEMAVQHLKKIKENNCSREVNENLENTLLEEHYLLGFEKCVEEVGNLVKEIPGMGTSLRKNLGFHLKNILEKFRRKKSKVSLLPSQQFFIANQNRIGRLEGNHENLQNHSIIFQGSKPFRILPSKLSNGDLILLISPDSNDCDKTMNNKTAMWRPW